MAAKHVAGTAWLGWKDEAGRYVLHVGSDSADATRAECGITIPYYSSTIAEAGTRYGDLELPVDPTDARLCLGCLIATRDP